MSLPLDTTHRNETVADTMDFRCHVNNNTIHKCVLAAGIRDLHCQDNNNKSVVKVVEWSGLVTFTKTSWLGLEKFLV